jgi:RecJ-like exonuclease
MALVAITMAGCDYSPFGYTPIKDIIAAPASFEGKEVKIKGKVKNAVQLPGLKAYTLEDETGRMTITVVTEGQLPTANAEVALKGTVKTTLIVGGATLGLRIEEMKRLR